MDHIAGGWIGAVDRVLRVGGSVRAPPATIAALHDVVEDTPAALAEIAVSPPAGSADLVGDKTTGRRTCGCCGER